MKKLTTIRLLWPVFFLFLVSLCTQEVKEKKIPITTDSELAIELYNKGIIAGEEVNIGKAMDLFKQALTEDPDFFMASYSLATYYLYFENEEEFQKYAEKALQSEVKLSKGEELLKTLLEKLLADPKANVTEIGKELVEMYPDDDQAYFPLAFSQMIVNDYQGVVETYKKVLEIAENPAPIYNGLGYAYMELEQFDDAESALDKYIELEPDLPNPYDSKGDYFMNIEDYGKAYESYMKAHEIDTLWSYNKAMKAKALYDSLQVE